MSALVVPGAPRNLKISARYPVLESDVYDICQRIAEISDDLCILPLEHDPAYNFAVIENCRDGVERVVFKVKELDARVVERLRYLMSVPFHTRFEMVEKEEHRFKAQEDEKDMEELYETMGVPMWKQLHDSGFIQRPRSYAKAGVATRGKFRK